MGWFSVGPGLRTLSSEHWYHGGLLAAQVNSVLFLSSYFWRNGLDDL